MIKKKENLSFVILACLTLGLAPFYPEPHIIGKIRWIIGGGEGMEFMDYLDLLWHGAPWAILLFIIIRYFYLQNFKTQKST